MNDPWRTDPRDVALEVMLEEVLGGRRPPDLANRIAEACMRKQPRGQRRLPLVAWFIACAAAGLMALSWAVFGDQPVTPRSLQVAVHAGAVDWQSGPHTRRVIAGESRAIEPCVADRLRTVSATDVALEGLGRLRCAPATELEILDMQWKQASVSALVLAVLVGSVAWFSQEQEGVATAGEQVVLGLPLRDAPTARGGKFDPASAATAERRSLRQSVRARVHGVCVTEGGRPLADCAVRLAAISGRQVVPVGARRVVDVPAPVRTGPDGVFAFELEPAPDLSWVLSCSGGDCVCVECRIEVIEPDEVVALGAVMLPSGIRVRGMIVDAQQLPVGKVALQLARAPALDPLDRQPSPVGVTHVRSDAHGSFLSDPILPGTYLPTLVAGTEFVMVAPHGFEVDAGSVVAISVRRRAADESIAGVVVDAAGVPVPGFGLRVVGTDRLGPVDVGRSDQHGAFTVVRERTAAGVAFVMASSDARLQAPDGVLETRWGVHDLRVVVLPRASLQVAVVEAGTGQPVIEYALHWASLPGGQFATEAMGSHPNGRAGLVAPSGELVLVVVPKDPELVASEPVTVDGSREREVRVELARRSRALHLRVVTADGRARAGVPAQLVGWLGNGPADVHRVAIFAPEELVQPQSRFDARPRGVVVARGQTDADGRVELRVPHREVAYGLCLPGPGHIPLIRDGLWLTAPTTDLEVTVALGATLRGRFLPVAEFTRLATQLHASLGRPRVVLSSPQSNSASRIIEIDPAGRFVGDGLPPGDCEVTAVLHFDLGQPERARLPIGAVRALAEGEVRDVEFDARALLLGRVQGRIQLDGAPYANRPVFYGERAIAETDARGRFSLSAPPGEVGLRILPVGVAAGIDPRQSIWLEPIVVPADSEVEREFAVAHRTVTLQLLEADGSPARERWIDVSAQHYDLPTDGQGRVRLDPAPTSPFSVWTRAKGVNAARARELAAGDQAALRDSAFSIATELRLPPVSRSVTIELRVPPGR